MSSRPASGSKPCPHCGARLDRGLAQHMTLGQCNGHEPSTPPTTTTNDLPDRYNELPLSLDEHDEREDEPIDIDERRDLADELAEAGGWPGE